MNKNPQSKTLEFIEKAIKKHGYKMIHINNFTNFLHHIMLSKQRNMLLF